MLHKTFNMSVTLKKRFQIPWLMEGKFLDRSKTNVFITQWLIIEAKQAKVALDL